MAAVVFGFGAPHPRRWPRSAGAGGPVARVLLLLGLWAVALAGRAQVPDWNWARQGQGAAVGQALAAAGSGYLVAGSFTATLAIGGTPLASAGAEDALLVRYAADGQPLWARSGGGPGRDVATAVSATAVSATAAGDRKKTQPILCYGHLWQ